MAGRVFGITSEFLQTEKAIIVYASVQHIEEHSKRYLGVPFPRPKKVKYDDLLKLCPICPSATVYDVSKSKKYYFDEQLGSLRDDYVYWLKS